MNITEGGFPFNEEEFSEHLGKDDNFTGELKEHEYMFRSLADLYFENQDITEKIQYLLEDYITQYIALTKAFEEAMEEYAKEKGFTEYTFIKSSLERLREQIPNLRNKIQNKAYKDKEDFENTLKQLGNAIERIRRFKEKLPQARSAVENTDIPFFEKCIKQLDATWKELDKIAEPKNPSQN